MAEAVGDAPVGFGTGDEVFSVTVPRQLPPGTERAVLHAARLARKPPRLPFAQAAGLPMAAVTAWQMLFEHGRLEPGETVVVRGADRAIGAFAVQLARAQGVRCVRGG